MTGEIAMGTEITIRPKVLEEYEAQLGALKKQVQNRTLKLSFAQSKGKLVDEMNMTAQMLEALGAAVGELISQTQTVINNARLGFREADKTSAQGF